MSVAAADASFERQPQVGTGGLIVRTAYRNIGRNRRRTWLTSGGIAFAVFLITASIALQDLRRKIYLKNSNCKSGTSA